MFQGKHYYTEQAKKNEKNNYWIKQIKYKKNNKIAPLLAQINLLQCFTIEQYLIKEEVYTYCVIWKSCISIIVKRLYSIVNSMSIIQILYSNTFGLWRSKILTQYLRYKQQKNLGSWEMIWSSLKTEKYDLFLYYSRAFPSTVELFQCFITRQIILHNKVI